MEELLLTDDPLNTEGFLERVLDPLDGAAVIFAGCIRNRENGEAISAIQYEAYLEMARKEIKNIVSDVRGRFGARVFIHHRLGRVPVRSPSLLVLCAAPHRKEAFEAAQFVIEKIKQDVTIWKVDFERAGT